MKTLRSNLIIFYIILISVLFPTKSFAADVVEKGEILTEDSYVFTLDEAREIRIQIEELEFRVSMQNNIIERFKQLDEIQQLEEVELKKIIEYKNEELIIYENLNSKYEKVISKLEKPRKLERILLVGSSIGGTIAMLLVADFLDDQLVENNLQSRNTSALNRQILTIKF